MKSSIGTQGLVSPVAYQLGRRCPVGQEVLLFAHLAKFWPTLPLEDARDELLRGLADRFNPGALPLPDEQEK